MKKFKKIFSVALLFCIIGALIPSVQAKATTSEQQAILNEAKRRIGTIKYQYGGNGPVYYDCSSFVQLVFKNSVSINLPRVTDDQAKRGTYVSRSELQIGDLIFFNTDAPLGHVGIYAGDNTFIHNSSTAGEVVISSLSNSYYNTRYATARRIVDSYKKVHVGEYINVKPFMETFPIFKDYSSFETYNRLALLGAPISVKVLDNPSKNVYKVKDCRYGYVGFVYVEENNNYTFTTNQMYEEVPLYKMMVDGVQVTDLCSTKWIPDIVKEQLDKNPRNIQINSCNNTSTIYQGYSDTSYQEKSEIQTAAEPLYKMLVNGVQVTDMCLAKWIPDIVKEQLDKDNTINIQITRCN